MFKIKYKKGDKIKCIRVKDDWRKVKLGKEYIIKEFSFTHNVVYLEGLTREYPLSYFKKVIQFKRKSGTRLLDAFKKNEENYYE